MEAERKYLKGGRLILDGMPFRCLSLVITYESHYAIDPSSTYDTLSTRRVSSLTNRIQLSISIDDMYERMKYMPVGKMGRPWNDWIGRDIRMEYEDGYGTLRVTDIRANYEQAAMREVLEIEGLIDWKHMPSVYVNTSSSNTSNPYYTTGSWNSSKAVVYDQLTRAVDRRTTPKKKSDMKWLDERVSSVRSRAA